MLCLPVKIQFQIDIVYFGTLCVKFLYEFKNFSAEITKRTDVSSERTASRSHGGWRPGQSKFNIVRRILNSYINNTYSYINNNSFNLTT